MKCTVSLAGMHVFTRNARNLALGITHARILYAREKWATAAFFSLKRGSEPASGYAE
jgi:hypothetical protein